MRLDETGDWLIDARQVRSPHCDRRPPSCRPELLIVHGISLPPGEFGTGQVDRLFLGTLCETDPPGLREVAHLRVSAHLLITRDGAVTQYVPFSLRAWHAGVSTFRGRASCNDFSIGVELEGTDDTLYEDAQYERLAAFCRLAMRAWPALLPDRIVGHSDVAPGRKTDPGPAFDWERLRSSITTSAMT
jgi:N-acetyl-anhydromuramoyl-L-alanine amidase